MQCCKISCWSDAGQQEIDWQPIAATALANDADCKYLQRAIFPMENETCFFYFSFFHGKWHMFFTLAFFRGKWHMFVYFSFFMESDTFFTFRYRWQDICLEKWVMFVFCSFVISNWLEKKGKLNWGNRGSNWSSQDSLTSNPE